MDLVQIIFLLITMITGFLIVKNTISLFFSIDNQRNYNKRLKQIYRKDKKDMEIEELIDLVSNPIIKHIFGRFKITSKEELEDDLKMAQWRDKISPDQFLAIVYLSKSIGIIAGILLGMESLPFGVIIGGVFFFAPGFLLRNEVGNKRNALLNDFPNFIRICQSYLMVGYPFNRAAEESIKFLNKDFQIVVEKFVLEWEIKGQDKALELLKDQVKIWEMKEFISLVRLTMDQGGNMETAFEQQADRIRRIKRDLNLVKIGKRKIYAKLVQFPLLLAIFVAAGLPTFYNVFTMSSGF